MQARPPETTESCVPKAAATEPASTSPIRGPPVTTTMNTPCSRPRRASGVATCRIVLRKMALTMSAGPGGRQREVRGGEEGVDHAGRPRDPEQQEREPQDAGEAEQRDRSAPDNHR